PFFFVNDTATTEIYTLSLHDALPICPMLNILTVKIIDDQTSERRVSSQIKDRKSTRLNSSHVRISYAVFCLEKKDNRHQLDLLLVHLDRPGTVFGHGEHYRRQLPVFFNTGATPGLYPLSLHEPLPI